VYTNSVPGDLKLLIDRCQAYHAEQTITGYAANGKQGLIFSVAGRKGKTHFSCITSVITAFMRNAGIKPAGELLIDGVDEARDIRNMKNLKEDVRALIGKIFDQKISKS
jgi:multimeric flavodoxin WrbA